MVLGFDEQKPYQIKSIYVHYLKDWVKLKHGPLQLQWFMAKVNYYWKTNTYHFH